MAERVCVGCKQIAECRDGRCADCRRARRQESDARRPTARQRGYDAEWERTRAEHLRIEPRCRVCGEPATDVDHVDGLGPNGPLGHEHSNLRSLCHSHHSQRTARDQPGGWHQGVG